VLLFLHFSFLFLQLSLLIIFILTVFFLFLLSVLILASFFLSLPVLLNIFTFLFVCNGDSFFSIFCQVCFFLRQISEFTERNSGNKLMFTETVFISILVLSFSY